MNIEIGTKPMNEISLTNLKDIAKIEGVHLYFEYWTDIECVNFSNTMFSDTIVVDFKQKRIDNNDFEKTIVFFFNFEKFSFHWHFIYNEENSRQSKRLSLESIKYLIKNGFDVPLY